MNTNLYLSADNISVSFGERMLSEDDPGVTGKEYGGKKTMDPGNVYFVIGTPCAGKSTVVKNLAEEIFGLD